MQCMEWQACTNATNKKMCIRDRARPDTIVVATGSVPLTPPIEGINSENVVTAEDVLYGKKDVNQGPVVVCGGGELGGCLLYTSRCV